MSWAWAEPAKTAPSHNHEWESIMREGFKRCVNKSRFYQWLTAWFSGLSLRMCIFSFIYISTRGRVRLPHEEIKCLNCKIGGLCLLEFPNLYLWAGPDVKLRRGRNGKCVSDVHESGSTNTCMTGNKWVQMGKTEKWNLMFEQSLLWVEFSDHFRFDMRTRKISVPHSASGIQDTGGDFPTRAVANLPSKISVAKW